VLFADTSGCFLYHPAGRKNRRSGFLAVFAGIFVYAQTPGPADPTPGAFPYQVSGDVNNDKSIDIIDALLVAQYYVGILPLS
jgi:hypothetical protein